MPMFSPEVREILEELTDRNGIILYDSEWSECRCGRDTYEADPDDARLGPWRPGAPHEPDCIVARAKRLLDIEAGRA